MNELTIGERRYRIVAVRRGDEWRAYAEQADDGRRFGVEYSGSSEQDAVSRLTEWLQWQAEHSAALEALQRAEHAYHRTIAGSAFVSAFEGPSAVEMQKEALDQVEAARIRLDEVRARKPE